MLYLAGLLISLLSSQTPTTSAGTLAWELGTRIQTSASGRITAVRYWRQADDPGPHTGHVWSAAGEKLAEVAFVDESPSGWQQQALEAPVSLKAGDTFVVSVNSPSGAHYAIQKDAFTAPVSKGPLSAPVNAGMYTPEIGGFPKDSIQYGYFRDVVFEPDPQPTMSLNPVTSVMLSPFGEVSVEGFEPGAVITVTVTASDGKGHSATVSGPLTIPGETK